MTRYAIVKTYKKDQPTENNYVKERIGAPNRRDIMSRKWSAMVADFIVLSFAFLLAHVTVQVRLILKSSLKENRKSTMTSTHKKVPKQKLRVHSPYNRTMAVMG